MSPRPSFGFLVLQARGYVSSDVPFRALSLSLSLSRVIASLTNAFQIRSCPALVHCLRLKHYSCLSNPARSHPALAPVFVSLSRHNHVPPRMPSGRQHSCCIESLLYRCVLFSCLLYIWMLLGLVAVPFFFVHGRSGVSPLVNRRVCGY